VLTPAAAKRMIARVNCRAGKVGRLYSKRVKRGRVISEKPRFGAVLRGGSKVDLLVSRGRKGSWTFVPMADILRRLG
jgi:beta-lactam-binding protein with PASTA domain